MNEKLKKRRQECLDERKILHKRINEDMERYRALGEEINAICKIEQNEKDKEDYEYRM